MSDWHDEYARKRSSAADAVTRVQRGDHVFVGSGCAEPQSLVRALAANPGAIDVEILHILTLGIAPYADSRFPDRFRHNALFIGANVRQAVNQGEADYTPVFLSEIPLLFRSGRLHLDVALIQTSPPDEAGVLSLGISVDVVRSALEAADLVIAEVNPRMPRTRGDRGVHIRDVDAVVEIDSPLLELPACPLDDVAREVARHVASLVPDEATLQLGIGEVPQALPLFLKDKHELGIHTEMCSDTIIDLIEAGIVTNRKKPLHTGKTITSFCMGSRRLYDYLHENPAVELHPVDHVNDPFVIAKHDKMVAINSALEVDLTGQVCADSIGSRFFSGIGGQVDFIRGASRSRGGRPIIAMRSTAERGTVSRIVPVLKDGAGIVTTRGDVHYVVTEYGVANLYGRSVRERTLALIAIAHPDFRADLLAAARARHFVAPTQIGLPERELPYPSDLAKRVSLRSGREALFRALRITDERALRDLFYSQTGETVYLRFGSPLKRLTPAQFQRFVTLDYDDRMAIGMFLGPPTAKLDDEFSKLLGVARWDLDPATGLAECAFVVGDDHQGRGVGTLLLLQLIQAARARRIEGFTAQVLASNSRMIHLFTRWCSPLESKREDGVITLRFRFADTDRATRQAARDILARSRPTNVRDDPSESPKQTETD